MRVLCLAYLPVCTDIIYGYEQQPEQPQQKQQKQQDQQGWWWPWNKSSSSSSSKEGIAGPAPTQPGSPNDAHWSVCASLCRCVSLPWLALFLHVFIPAD